MNALIPPWLYALIGAALIAVGSGAGFALERSLKNGEIAEIQLAHEKQVTAALTAQRTAERHAVDVERLAADTLSSLETKYTQDRENEKANSDHVVADLRNSVVRLRVATSGHASCGAMPSAATSPSTGDGQAAETLAGSVAARLAGRYADYNALVDQLNLCQGIISADRSMDAR
jgi:hypothetical protein